MHLIASLKLFCLVSIFSCDQAIDYPSTSQPKILKSSSMDSVKMEDTKADGSNILFQSKDGGETWDDISESLPGREPIDGFFTSDTDVYFRQKNAMYHSKSKSNTQLWDQEFILNPHVTTIAYNPSGVMAYNYEGQIYQRINVTGTWVPIYSNLQKQQVRSVFETSGGIIFVGSDSGLFRSLDKGQNWTQVQNEGWVMQIVENKDVLLAIGQKGIMRSTDNGAHWEWVISEGGVGIDIEKIEGGFAAITYNTQTKSRRVRVSMDEGKNWQAIDHGLEASESISSIKSYGKYLFCGHPNGIYRSSDMGKTWNLIKPSIDKKVYSLYISGNILYAIPRNFGC